jgi:hypothetical protein
MKKISYPAEMRDRAKADGRHLVTVDVPGMTFQGPCSAKQVKEACEMVTRWFKKENEEAEAAKPKAKSAARKVSK